LRPRHTAGAACLAVALVTTSTALAGFSTSTGDALSVSTAVLRAPSSPSAAVTACRPGDSADVEVTWTASASGATDGYAIYRSDDGGPSTRVGTVSGRATTSFDDTALPFDTSSTYTVEATRANWTSASSADASVTTPPSDCS
jgi:hypothetical protein